MDDEVDSRVVGSRVRQLRQERDWPARRLAEECARLGQPGLSRGTIAKIESGNRAKVSAAELAVLAEALGVTLEELLSEQGVTILHLSDLQLAPNRHGAPGKTLGHEGDWRPMLEGLCAALDAQLAKDFGRRIDLVVVSGGLTIAGKPGEFDVARDFLQALVRHLGIGFDRVGVVPGNHDVNLAACQAYFNDCEADDMEPVEPYWPKWRHFTRLFRAWPDQGARVRIEAEQPWTVFEIAELKVVVAGLNSTIKDSHVQRERYGWIGDAQATWFATAMERYRRQGWLRIGLVHHNPLGQAGRPEENLRDAELLNATLGTSLHLLLHGHGDTQHELPSGLIAVGAGCPVPAGTRAAKVTGRVHLLRLDESGLQRRTLTYEGGRSHWAADSVVVTTRQWEAVHGAFPRSRGTPPAVVQPLITAQLGGPPEPGKRPHWLDARRRLLDSVADVCAARYPGAVVHRIDGHPPYLRVTYADGDVTRQVRIGASPGQFDQPDVDAFLARVHAADPHIESEFIYQAQGFEPPAAIREYAARRGVRLRSFVTFQGLLNLSRYVATQTEQLSSDRIYPPAAYVSQRYTDLTTIHRSVREDLVKEMLRILDTDDGRFLLLLGDFGRGKTFALRELARRIPDELPGLIPIFIELRTLDKAHTVDELVAAHLANHRHDNINLQALRYMLRNGLIVLIFDGFDELVARATYARAAEHLRTLVSAAEGRAKIVVASRTQHFQTHSQVLTAIGDARGLPQRRVFSVEELSDDQIRSFLIQRYDGDLEVAERRIRLLIQIPDLSTLARIPRMLGLIADLGEEELRAVMSSRGAVSAAALYQQILGSWLEHEAARTQDIVGVPVGLGVDDLWIAVTQLAIRMWETDEALIGLEELGDFARTLTGLASGHLSAGQIAHAVGAGSLLWRTDEGLFGFIHSSVMEWLIAEHVANLLSRDPDQLTRMLGWKALSSLTVEFLSGLADAPACHDWIQSVRRDAGASDNARLNASRIDARLRSYPQGDMRGADLSGQDLTLKAWQGIDLSEANLTHTVLFETNLAGVNLRNARLTGAVLDRVNMAGADLTGANLSRAQITDADLRGAKLDGVQWAGARVVRSDLSETSTVGTQWRRSALLNITADPGVLETARSEGAAVIPGQRVENAMMPATVGVRFGFDEGRLPRPVAYDADGGLLAIGNEDGTVLVCDADSSLPLRTLAGHAKRTYAVMFSPTDPVLATGSLDESVCLWDADTGECRHVLTGSSGWVWPMLFSADGSLLAAGDALGTMRIWEVATGRLRTELPGHRAPIWTASFQPSSGWLAVGDEGGGGRIWDLETGSVVSELNTNGRIMYWLRYDQAGDLLAGAGDDGVLRVWDARSGELRHELVGHTGPIYAFDFDSTGDGIVSADVNGTVLAWDLRADDPSVPQRLDRHEGSVYRITFSPAGRFFATGDSEGTVRLWDSESRTIHYELTRHDASVWPMMFRPDGERLVTSSNDFTTKVWDTVHGSLVATITGHDRRIWSVAFSGDGSMLATAGLDGRVRLWEPQTGKLLRVIELRSAARLISAVFSLSPEPPALLATAVNDGRVLLWFAETGEEGRHLEVATDDVWAVVFSPDGKLIAAATDENTIQLLFRSTGRTLITLAGPSGRVRALAFSRDGRQLASAGDDWVVRLWDWDRGVMTAELGEHTGRVHALAYHPHRPELASVGVDGTFVIWDLQPDPKVVRWVKSPQQGRLWSVVYHPNGKWLVTAGESGVIDIWDAEDGSPVHRLHGHLNRVWSLAFNPAGTLMASCGDDGKVILWTVTEEGVTEAATLLGMHDDEWVAFTPDGRHKGNRGQSLDFWHVVGMSRFEVGELEAHVSDVRQLADDDPLID